MSSSSIAGVIVVSNTIVSLASGMTIKFFPVFFAKRVGLDPTWVCGLVFLTTALIAAATWLAQKAER